MDNSKLLEPPKLEHFVRPTRISVSYKTKLSIGNYAGGRNFGKFETEDIECTVDGEVVEGSRLTDSIKLLYTEAKSTALKLKADRIYEIKATVDYLVKNNKI